MKKIIVYILISLIGYIVFLQFDDSLDTEVVNLLSKIPRAKDSKGFTYIMGIEASKHENPMNVGANIIQSIRDGEVGYISHGAEFEYTAYPEKNELSVPEGKLFCNFWLNDCLSGLFSSNDIEQIVSKNKVLLERYQTFMKFDDYSTLSKPILETPYPSFIYITRGNRLVVLESIRQAKSKHFQKALNILKNNIKNIRRQLELQDTLIGKIVASVWLSENINVAYLIAMKSDEKNIFKISQLNSKEKNMARAISWEFSAFYYTMKHLQGNNKFFKEGWNTPAFIVNLAFKPNMTTNAVFPACNEFIINSKLPYPSFLEKINNPSIIQIQTNKLRNYFGSILASIAFPDFNPYIARIFNLDIKIKLYNQLISKKTKVVKEVANIRFVYDGFLLKLFTERKKVCFDGLFSENKGTRCLQVKL